MIKRHLLLACALPVDMQFPDEAAADAFKAQSDKDHAEGRGCHLCKPGFHNPHPVYADGSSLLDHTGPERKGGGD